MNALPAAAAAIGSGFLSSLGQLAASPWALVPLAVAAAIGGGCIWYARRPGHVVIAPPPEVGDDVIAQFGSDAELDREIDEWLRRFGRG